MEYTTITQYSPSDLAKMVNQYFKGGWECQGGMAVTFLTDTGGVLYAQAMIKKEIA